MIRTKIFYNVFCSIAAAGLGFFVMAAAIPLLSGIDFKNFQLSQLPRAYIILSGSMEPTVPVGGIVFTRTQPSYNAGDIVTFATDRKKDNVVTHRIHEQLANGAFITKGDANKTTDRGEVTQQNVIGKVVLTVPYAGYLVDFVKTPKGFVLLVIVPATIIIYEELKSILKELSAFLRSLREKWLARKRIEVEQSHGEVAHVRSGQSLGWTKAAGVFPILFAFLVITVGAHAYFNDHEVAQANFLGAADSYTTPTPTNQVIVDQTQTPTPTPTEVILDITPTASPTPTPTISEEPTPTPTIQI
jgi:signal peptidase